MGALRFIRWVYRTFGRRATIAFLTPVVAYFFVTGRAVRRASLDYLRTLWAAPGGREALGAPPTLRHAFRHLHEFAEQVVDRMIVWSGDTESIEVDYDGTEILLELSQQRRGAILLGSHLGSCDLLRSVAERTGVTLNVLDLHGERGAHQRVLRAAAPGVEAAHDPVRARLDPLGVRHEGGDRARRVGRRDGRSGLGVGARARGRRDVPRPPRALPARPVPAPGRARLPDDPHRLLPHRRRPLPRRRRSRSRPPAWSRAATGASTPRSSRSAMRTRSSSRCLRAPYQWFNFFEFWPEDGA